MSSEFEGRRIFVVEDSPVVADDSAEILQELGCSDAQGWLFGRPVAAATIRERFKAALPQAPAGIAKEGAPADAKATAERRDFGRRGSSRRAF